MSKNNDLNSVTMQPGTPDEIRRSSGEETQFLLSLVDHIRNMIAKTQIKIVDNS